MSGVRDVVVAWRDGKRKKKEEEGTQRDGGEVRLLIPTGLRV